MINSVHVFYFHRFKKGFQDSYNDRPSIRNNLLRAIIKFSDVESCTLMVIFFTQGSFQVELSCFAQTNKNTRVVNLCNKEVVRNPPL